MLVNSTGKSVVKIFGGGLSGLIAAIANPRATVLERNSETFQGHHALLRFRSNAISELTGINFKKVNVIKSIWSDGEERKPSPRLVAMYSKKNTGHYENRSIMDISTTTRYIAPDDFQQQLIKECEGRIDFGYTINESDFLLKEDKISTLPISFNAKMLGYSFDTEKNKSMIFVNKYKIAKCNMYCTVYYPDSYSTVYRASITGNILIIESKDTLTEKDFNIVARSLGITESDYERFLPDHIQPMGKLSSVPDSQRRDMIYKMSHDHGVFSLGRFALHKNILLDDVAKDIKVIKDMMKDDAYGISTKGRI